MSGVSDKGRRPGPLTRFARYTFLAFSIAATSLGALKEARSTAQLYEQASENVRIEYVQGKQSLYPGSGPKKKDDHDEEVQLIKSAVAFVMTGYAFICRSGCPFTRLTDQLSGFTYVVRGSSLQNDPVRTLVLERPSNPFELDELQSLLKRHSFFYTFDDGSGFFHEGNTFMGDNLA